MATVVVEVDSEPSCSIPNPTSTSPSLSHRFLDSKFYLLVVIGELVTEEHLRRAIANIERGEAAGAGAPQAAPRHPPPAPAPPWARPVAGSAPPTPSPPSRGARLFIPWGMPPQSPTHPPTFPRGVRSGGAAASPVPAIAGRRGRAGSPPSPSARRHRRVGVARSALRSRRQPGADKGRPGMRYMDWAGAAGRLPPAVPPAPSAPPSPRGSGRFPSGRRRLRGRERSRAFVC